MCKICSENTMKIHFFSHLFIANFEHILFYFSVFYVDCEHTFWGFAIINSSPWDFVCQHNYLLSPGYFAFTYWLAVTTAVKVIVQPHPQSVLSFMYYKGQNVLMIRLYGNFNYL